MAHQDDWTRVRGLKQKAVQLDGDAVGVARSWLCVTVTISSPVVRADASGPGDCRLDLAPNEGFVSKPRFQHKRRGTASRAVDVHLVTIDEIYASSRPVVRTEKPNSDRIQCGASGYGRRQYDRQRQNDPLDNPPSLALDLG